MLFKCSDIGPSTVELKCVCARSRGVRGASGHTFLRLHAGSRSSQTLQAEQQVGAPASAARASPPVCASLHSVWGARPQGTQKACRKSSVSGELRV